MRNCLRELLNRDRASLGAWVTLTDPSIPEIMGAAGLDYVAIDLEHSVIGLETLQNHLRAARAWGLGTLIRVTANDPGLISRVLDAGAEGILVPHMAQPAEAHNAAQAVRFPPLGQRAVSAGSRGAEFGAHGLPGLKELSEKLNQDVVLAFQLEHRDAVDNIDALVTTPGLDMVQIGPGDLSASYGRIGTVNHADTAAGMERIRQACANAGVKLGMTVNHQSYKATFSELQGQGYKLLLIGGDAGLLAGHLRATVARVRQE